MPILKDTRDIKNIKLPKSGITVKVRDGLLASDIEKIENEKSDIKRNILLLSFIIEDWDATDENEQKLPISIDNLNLLDMLDVSLIYESLGFVKDFLAKANQVGMK